MWIRVSMDGGKGKGRGRETDLERRRELRLGLVVTGKTVDTRLDENHAELGVW
jgi:hypothetical protein